MKARRPSPRHVNSIPGQIESKLERAAAVWRRRCEGTTIPDLAREFSLSIGTIHNYLEKFRRTLREECVDLAAQEREQNLQLLDASIAELMPYIKDGALLRIQETKERKGGPVTITIPEYDAKMNAINTLVRVIDLKAKLLGMDAPQKIEQKAPVQSVTPEQEAAGMELLRRWCNFAPHLHRSRS
ncbi:MAG TPA: hypothetical protein VIS99_07110 [Terrimicrobiaceae bacterium]